MRILKLLINAIKAYKKKHTAWYKKDYKLFLESCDDIVKSDFQIVNNYPCVREKFMINGPAKGAYFHQDIYVAREIFNANPVKHVDIGSRIDGFVAHVAIWRKIEVFDIRPLDFKTKNIEFKQADLMELDDSLINYCDSISSLHTIEHFGLGRYGDPINPNGHLVGVENIFKILKSKGIFYFSVPLGTNRIEFNAHRVFSLKYLVNWLNPYFLIIKFSYVDDDGDIHEDVELTDNLINDNCECNFGCAIFVLMKK